MGRINPIEPINNASAFYDLCRHIYNGKNVTIKKKARKCCMRCRKEKDRGELYAVYCHSCRETISHLGALAQRKPAKIHYDDERFAGGGSNDFHHP